MEKLTFLRYKVIRQLSFPMPLLSSNVPFLGGKTVPEVAVIVLVAIIFLVVACRGSLGTSGTAAQLLASAAILGSLRILNVYSIIFGISFERAIFWHKSMVALFVACIVVHSVTNVKAGNIDKSGINFTVPFH